MPTATLTSVRSSPPDVTGPADAARKAGSSGALEATRAVRLFNIGLVDTTLGAAAEWIVARAVGGDRSVVSFLNAHCVNVMYRDPAYVDALSRADRIHADGSGMAIAAHASGLVLRGNVNGTDLFPVLCEVAARDNAALFLLGGQPGIAGRAGERMVRDNPTLAIAGTHHGFIESAEAETQLIRRINASGAQILLVGMGVPTQELWIERNRHRLAPSVLIAVGGLFDYYSDRIARAPAPLRAAGLEWIWRLAMEPRRLGRRYLLGNIEFLARLAWLRIMRPGDFDQQLVA